MPRADSTATYVAEGPAATTHTSHIRAPKRVVALFIDVIKIQLVVDCFLSHIGNSGQIIISAFLQPKLHNERKEPIEVT
jgi:hypothetical protein